MRTSVKAALTKTGRSTVTGHREAQPGFWNLASTEAGVPSWPLLYYFLSLLSQGAQGEQ